VVMGPHGSGACVADSHCSLRCLGGCAVTCAPTASCELACDVNEPLRPFAGTAGCP
jgi:hypothetical protein